MLEHLTATSSLHTSTFGRLCSSDEESILNLSEFHGSRAFLGVIRHVVDPRAYGIAPHQPGIGGLQQIGRRSQQIVLADSRWSVQVLLDATEFSA
jgi:hypothetical protein